MLQGWAAAHRYWAVTVSGQVRRTKRWAATAPRRDIRRKHEHRCRLLYYQLALQANLVVQLLEPLQYLHAPSHRFEEGTQKGHWILPKLERQTSVAQTIEAHRKIHVLPRRRHHSHDLVIEHGREDHCGQLRGSIFRQMDDELILHEGKGPDGVLF